MATYSTPISSAMPSVSIAELFIGGAFHTCDPFMVHQTFDSIFGKGIVGSVDGVKTSKHGKDFMLFFIHIASSSPLFDLFLARIRTEKQVRIMYDDPHFWKIQLK